MKLRRDLVFRHPAEKQAWHYLSEKHHIMLCHNYHARFCEIDLITFDPVCVIHVIEVKSWHENSLSHPLESLDHRRRTKQRQAFGLFLADAALNSEIQNKLSQKNINMVLTDCAVSFDLIWCKETKIEWFQAVF